jgi:hypothetical protein
MAAYVGLPDLSAVIFAANPLQEWGRGIHRGRHPAEAALEERLHDSKDCLWIEVNLWYFKNTEFTVLRFREVNC